MFGLFKFKKTAAPPRPPESAAAAALGGVEHILRRLEWTVIKRLDGLLQGDYRTLLRGTGIDLADLREYQHHDDVRHIDWNVTARLQVPHVRVFTEDREMTAWFLLDLSPSVDFGSGEKRKRHMSEGFVAVMARLLTRHGNRIGALMYGAGVDTVIPAGSGRRRVRSAVIAWRIIGIRPYPKEQASFHTEPSSQPPNEQVKRREPRETFDDRRTEDGVSQLWG